MRRVLGGFLKLITALALVGVIVVSIMGGAQISIPTLFATSTPIPPTATLTTVERRLPTREWLTAEPDVVPVAIEITKLTFETNTPTRTPIPIFTRPIMRLVTLTLTPTNTRTRPAPTVTLTPTSVEPTVDTPDAATGPTSQPPPPTNPPVAPTDVLPTNTPIPRTAVPPTNTPPPTAVPPTNTPLPTAVPPTNTPPPTAVPPTNTPPPTPVPPTETPTETPTDPPLLPPILETLLPLVSPPAERTEEACAACSSN